MTRTLPPRRPPRRPQRRGAIFILALGITVILGALVLIFASEMRTEAVVAANRLSAAKADAIAEGAQQWVMAQIDLAASDAVTLTELPAEAIPVGDGYFWIIRPAGETADTWEYGITDEAAKLNINAATRDQLLMLPNMTEDIADGIIEWRGGGTGGGSSFTYASLPEPYDVKLAPFETLDELLLVADITPDLLYGRDRNRDGVLSTIEQSATTSAFGGFSLSLGGEIEDDGRGWAHLLTVYSIQPPQGRGGGGGGGNNRPTVGRINVNTASAPVLQTLGLSQSDADALVSARSGSSTTTGTQWVAATLGPQKAASIAQRITGTSNQFSADIVAVSGDGRAFKRIRIVVDTRSVPYAIIYRKDLTDQGWPLPPEIRQSLRAGTGLTGLVSNNAGFGTSLSR